MEVLAAVVLGIAAGMFIKGVFLKDSNVMWDVVCGAIGGLVAWFLSGQLSESIYGYVAILGTATVIAGVLAVLMGRFTKTTA
jgi:uncharacterized membrane protein YeaQ/YmgE (transglycosylase-associated protein family)